MLVVPTLPMVSVGTERELGYAREAQRRRYSGRASDSHESLDREKAAARNSVPDAVGDFSLRFSAP